MAEANEQADEQMAEQSMRRFLIIPAQCAQPVDSWNLFSPLLLSSLLPGKKFVGRGYISDLNRRKWQMVVGPNLMSHAALSLSSSMLLHYAVGRTV